MEGSGLKQSKTSSSKPISSSSSSITTNTELFQMIAIKKICNRCISSGNTISNDILSDIQSILKDFFVFVISEAAYRAKFENRQIIQSVDIIYALQHLGFDDFSTALTLYMNSMNARDITYTYVKKP